jgi:hypothetical protein
MNSRNPSALWKYLFGLPFILIAALLYADMWLESDAVLRTGCSVVLAITLALAQFRLRSGYVREHATKIRHPLSWPRFALWGMIAALSIAIQTPLESYMSKFVWSGAAMSFFFAMLPFWIPWGIMVGTMEFLSPRSQSVPPVYSDTPQ